MKAVKNFAGYFAAIAIIMLTASCGGDTVPKPQAFLRLDYPMGTYVPYDGSCPFTFPYNSLAQIKDKGNCNLTIEYPKMKATVFLTYKEVTDDNLNDLLRDAQKLTYEHVIKADGIGEQAFIRPENKVYGMFYQVGGDAATNAQFYVTDSVKHFLTGSMYFYAKPNYDSIMPAASYIKDDIRTMMEYLKWK